MRLLITGGGTGGHVYPLLAVLQSLAADRVVEPTREVRYAGRSGSIEERLAAQTGVGFVGMRVGGLRTLVPWRLARNLLLMRAAGAQVRRVIHEFRPQAVLATGGYVSAPVIRAAASAGVPVVIYLPDLEPGWAIRVLSRSAKKVAVSFAEAARYFPREKVVVTGYPVRAEFYTATRAEARAHFKLDPNRRVLTIFGGSTGAHSINQAVYENLRELLELAQVIHVSGPRDEPMLQGHRAGLSEAQASRYLLFPYMDREMPLALAAADLVIARAGAATLGEFPALGVPSVLVPYPHAGRHQEKNARYLVSCGAAMEIRDEQLGSELVPTVGRLLNDAAQLGEMAKAARVLARPQAAAEIGKLLQQVAVG